MVGSWPAGFGDRTGTARRFSLSLLQEDQALNCPSKAKTGRQLESNPRLFLPSYALSLSLH